MMTRTVATRDSRKPWTIAATNIKTYAGTNESYFADYKGGVVSIVNNKSGKIVESYSVDSGELIEQTEA